MNGLRLRVSFFWWTWFNFRGHVVIFLLCLFSGFLSCKKCWHEDILTNQGTLHDLKTIEKMLNSLSLKYLLHTYLIDFQIRSKWFYQLNYFHFRCLSLSFASCCYSCQEMWNSTLVRYIYFGCSIKKISPCI